MASSVRSTALAVFLVFGASPSAQEIVVNEIVASGGELEDADGNTPDWIELRSTSDAPVSLLDWHLTDDPTLTTRWSFPPRTLAPGELLVVFASGKDRRPAIGELHTDFALDADGEFLALLRPDGSVAHDATFPPQRDGFSWGTARLDIRSLIEDGAMATAYVPESDELGMTWTGDPRDEPFDDSAASGWSAGRIGVGFDTSPDRDGDDSLLLYWSFDEDTDPLVAGDGSGKGNVGRLDSQAQLHGGGGGSRPARTTDGAGRSGRPGDRSLDLGESGNGAIVDVPSAARGAFDSCATNDAITIALWLFGASSQPSGDSVFWAAPNADGSGTRALNAHVPWSDRTIYWDAGGCCDGSNRISRSDPDATNWRGRWRHWTFVKDGARREIWRDGELFASGEGLAPLPRFRSLIIGGAATALSYGGRIDDVALWDRALDGDDIGRLAEGASPLALSSFATEIGLDLAASMLGRTTSARVRIPFDVPEGSSVDSLLLDVRYDDGFVAWIDGREVARRNAPLGPVPFDARAILERSRRESLLAERIDISRHADVIAAGRNILAVQLLNARPDDPDLLVLPRLTSAGETPGRILSPPTPGAPNADGATGFAADVTISMPRGHHRAPFDLVIECATPDATIYWTDDGDRPSPERGARYTGPIRVDRTTVIRSAAYRDDLWPSSVETRTYIFARDVSSQSGTPPGLPRTWSGGFPADYGMDPDVVSATLPGYGLEDALASLPTMSLVLPPNDLWSPEQGIYYDTGRGDERAASLELIHPDGTPGFQVDAGVRMHGLTSRQHGFTPKHSFRLFFRREYGAGKLEHRLFPDSDVTRFDQLVLRGMSTDSWCVQDGWPIASEGPDARRWYREKAQYLREQWMKDSMRDMGRPATHGNFVHLFLGGLYWGVYNLTERPTDSHLAEHDEAATDAQDPRATKDDYDVMKDFGELQSGSRGPWDELMAAAANGLASDAAYHRIQGLRVDSSRDPRLPRLVDVGNLIDYMILHILAGADDWPNHNWWAGRWHGADSRPELAGHALDQGFRFFPWDQEISLQNLRYSHTSWGPLFEDAAAPNTPSLVYSRLRANETFRRQFGDRVEALLFGDGALTPARNIARLLARSEEVDRAIVAESARWGDSKRATPYTREREWLAEQRYLVEEHFPRLGPIALGRFRRAGLYPGVDAPAISPRGGRVFGPTHIDIASAGRTVYYTLDGEDPRRPDGSARPDARTAALRDVTLVERGASARLHVPLTIDDFDADWTSPGFDDTRWTAGPMAIGYERAAGYEELIATDVAPLLFERGAVIFARIEFEIPDGPIPTAPRLRIMYDDGFVAWLNGVEVARDRAPDALEPGARATRSHDDASASRLEEFALPPDAPLRSGRNVLALAGLNTSPDNVDFLLLPVLVARAAEDGGLTISGTETLRARALEGGEWSALVVARYHGTETSDLAITEIMYHPPPSFSPDAWDANEYEFLEIANLGSRPAPLRGLRLRGEVAFDFDLDDPRTLAPGEHAVLVGHVEAFASRYDVPESVVLGEFRHRLDDGGGPLRLEDPLGEVIAEFTYDDEWYPDTDGDGRALALVLPVRSAESLSTRDGWRAGDILGTPGAPDDVAPRGGRQRTGDLNQDGAVDISDPIALLGALFLGTGVAPPCDAPDFAAGASLDVLDANGDARVDLSDAIHLLAYLFRGGLPPGGGATCREIEGCPDLCEG